MEEYTVENLKNRFQKHAEIYEIHLKINPVKDIPDAEFNISKALAVICAEIEKLKQNNQSDTV